MANLMYAARYYRAASTSRSLREQEADVFRRVSGGLRAARTGTPIERTRALAENRHLWLMVRALVRDPDNALDTRLRGSLISVAMAAQREMDRPDPDLEFLISLNENIAAGLAG
jgi:flagellar biosynthesis regulator FlaF